MHARRVLIITGGGVAHHTWDARAAPLVLACQTDEAGDGKGRCLAHVVDGLVCLGLWHSRRHRYAVRVCRPKLVDFG